MPNADGSPDTALDARELYIDRELSWLAFNGRVLEQAEDPRWPLLERVKFLAIFGSNLDEFFMIRVSGLHDQLESHVVSDTPGRRSIREQLSSIRDVVMTLTRRADQLLRNELLPALNAAGIRLLSFAELSPDAKASARDYFQKNVFPVLTPLAVDPAHPFPFLSNLSLSLAVEAEDPTTLERRFARLKVPASLPRFLEVPRPPGTPRQDGSVELIALEELIASNLDRLFPGTRILGCYPLRVTRDMDLDILEEEADDLLAAVDREVRQRRFGAAVRLETRPEMPEHVREMLLQKLEIDRDDVYEVGGLLGLSGLFTVAQLPYPQLRDPVFVPRQTVDWTGESDPFAAIRDRDVLLHHPYESFSPVLEFLRRAADDPDVLAIKMTLYRAGKNSDAVRALARAAENGKQVAVSIELKARFDEAENIGWARALERAGAHVFYGISGLKTHAKVLLVVRREGTELRRYVHLATGNYNATTARLYTDLGLFTANPEIGADASELFNALSGFAAAARYSSLVVAPLELRSTLLSKIAEQAARARTGRPARIFAKMNSLVDPEIIRELYRASQAGVNIELVVRGVCCLRARVPGISERIRVRSVLGRFLEHERIAVFGPPGEERFFLSSADWMPRNLDRRVEVMFPVHSAAVCERIRQECLAPLELDGARVYEMHADGQYRPVHGAGAELDIQAQVWTALTRRSSEHLAPM